MGKKLKASSFILLLLYYLHTASKKRRGRCGWLSSESLTRF